MSYTFRDYHNLLAYQWNYQYYAQYRQMMEMRSNNQMTEEQGKSALRPDMQQALRANKAAVAKLGNPLDLRASENSDPPQQSAPTNVATLPVIYTNLAPVLDILLVNIPEPGIFLSPPNQNAQKVFLKLSQCQFQELAKMYRCNQIKKSNKATQTGIRELLQIKAYVAPKPPHNDEARIRQKILDRNQYKHKLNARVLEQQARRAVWNPRRLQAVDPVRAALPKRRGLNISGSNEVQEEPVTCCYGTPLHNSPVNTMAAAFSAASKSATAINDNQAPPPASIYVLDEQAEPGFDKMIKLRVYLPIDPDIYIPISNSGPPPIRCYEVYLTGGNRLCEIRDSIACNKKNRREIMTRDENSFLFINKVFYIDYNERKAEYIKFVQRWCEKRRVKDYRIMDIRATRFDAVNYVLGGADMYVHDYTCNHVMTFMEERWVRKKDMLYLRKYPVLAAETMMKIPPFCFHCIAGKPKWLVADIYLKNRSLVCERCLKATAFRNGDLQVWQINGGAG